MRDIRALDKFHRKMDKFRRRNQQDARRLDQLVESLALDPYHNTKVSHDPEAPLRIARSGDRRLFYQYCRDCRLRGVEDKIGCVDCAETDDETIKLFDFDHRDTAYDKKRSRR